RPRATATTTSRSNWRAAPSSARSRRRPTARRKSSPRRKSGDPMTYIGTPTSRVDGHAKVTGAAQYAAEFIAPDLAYGALVTSTIARGRISRIDAGAARAVPGVLDVLTHSNRPAMAGT